LSEVLYKVVIDDWSVSGHAVCKYCSAAGKIAVDDYTVVRTNAKVFGA